MVDSPQTPSDLPQKTGSQPLVKGERLQRVQSHVPGNSSSQLVPSQGVAWIYASDIPVEGRVDNGTQFLHKHLYYPHSAESA